MKSPQQHLGYSSTTKFSEGKGQSGAQAPTLDWSEVVFHSLLLWLLELPCRLSGLHCGDLIFCMLEGDELLLSFSTPTDAGCYKALRAVGPGKQCWTGHIPECCYTHRGGISRLSANSLL